MHTYILWKYEMKLSSILFGQMDSDSERVRFVHQSTAKSSSKYTFVQNYFAIEIVRIGDVTSRE